ncbi:unnamed protein product [Cochlearia groenlandica]
MGAVAINRKRSEESLNFNQQSTTHPSTKKPRFSFAMPEASSSSSSSLNHTISRISMYPEAKSPLLREIDAPSRGILKYGSIAAKPKREDRFYKESFFARRYEIAMKTALDALRYFRRDKVVIDLGEDDMPVKEDSRIEEDVVDFDDEKSIEKKKKKKKKKSHNPSSSSSYAYGFDTPVVKNLRVDDDETSTMVDLGREAKDDDASRSLEAYKKLMQSAERRDSKLEALGFEIALHEKRLSQLRKSRLKPTQKKPIEVPREPFVPLTEEEEAEVYRAFSERNRKKVLATHENSNIDITGEVLQCLAPTSWLNDEVINVYLELLKARETREPKKYLKCHFFNTFFYKKLVGDSGYNYKAVRRWTTHKKIGYALIDCDMIFVPVHRGVHWTLAVINNRDRKFMYLDSLNGVDPMILNALSKYLGDEAKEKSGKNIDVSSWDMEFVEDLPQQQNGYDCGVFMLKYIDFFSRGLELCFSQEHMPYFRLRTAKEILRLRAY